MKNVLITGAAGAPPNDNCHRTQRSRCRAQAAKAACHRAILSHGAFGEDVEILRHATTCSPHFSPRRSRRQSERSCSCGVKTIECESNCKGGETNEAPPGNGIRLIRRPSNPVER
jgi:hypothetical protein